MSSINKAILVGNLCADPELRYTPGGQAVANLRLATNRKFKNKSGQVMDEAEFHRVVVWGKQAEACQQYLTKGRQVYVEGRLATRQWEDREGVKRFTTEIVASTVQFLGSGQGSKKAVSQTQTEDNDESEQQQQFAYNDVPL